MTNSSINSLIMRVVGCRRLATRERCSAGFFRLIPLAIALALFAGCGTPQYASIQGTEAKSPETKRVAPKRTEPKPTEPKVSEPKLPDGAASPDAITLREGDVVRITFPGSPALDTQPITVRQDGLIALPLVGEVKAAGLTPGELEKDLVKRYSTQLVSKEVLVTVVSSSYVVYVSGAVLRPGRVSSTHPISALEAIMEAGGFDQTRANLKEVRVIRQEGAQSKTFTLNLKKTLEGKNPPFYLKASDIVHVPERFSWF